MSNYNWATRYQVACAGAHPPVGSSSAAVLLETSSREQAVEFYDRLLAGGREISTVTGVSATPDHGAGVVVLMEVSTSGTRVICGTGADRLGGV